MTKMKQLEVLLNKYDTILTKIFQMATRKYMKEFTIQKGNVPIQQRKP